MEEVIAGRYAVGAELGRGGMARVVAARDLRLHRAVAIKLLPADAHTSSDPSARRRFVREARAAASFSHPHAVAVFDAGDADGVLYLVMELVDGPSLATLLAGHRQLGIDEAVRIADQVLQALEAAHRAGIVHRDVKPGNVLITPDGAAKLADFGIAKPLGDLAGNLTATGQLVGTPTYLSPEQVAGQPATAATDLYSTGVLLFEMLAGGPPYDAGTPMATALAHRDAPVPDVRTRRADVPAPIAEAVRRAMAKDPAARFASAEQMRAALDERTAAAGTAAAADGGDDGRRPAPVVPGPVVVVAGRRRRRARRWRPGRPRPGRRSGRRPTGHDVGSATGTDDDCRAHDDGCAGDGPAHDDHRAGDRTGEPARASVARRGPGCARRGPRTLRDARR